MKTYLVSYRKGVKTTKLIKEEQLFKQQDEIFEEEEWFFIKLFLLNVEISEIWGYWMEKESKRLYRLKRCHCPQKYLNRNDLHIIILHVNIALKRIYVFMDECRRNTTNLQLNDCTRVAIVKNTDPNQCIKSKIVKNWQ